MRYTDTAHPITTPDEVLAGLMGARDQLRDLELGNVVLAVEWAKHHPAKGGPASVARAVGPAPSRFEDSERIWSDLAAMGCLHFDDFQLSEFAIAAGLTEYSARKLLRESLMLVQMLPRVWGRVLDGGLDVWRARALAADCWGLSPEAIEFIDAQMSDVTARITQTSRERIVDEARRKFAPAPEKTEEEEAKSARCVDVGLREEQHGVAPLFGVLDLADALALDAALTTGAQALKDLGSDAPLDVRRSWALGDLARAASGHGTLFPVGAGVTAGSAHSEQTGTWVPAGAVGKAPDFSAERPFWNGKGASPPQVKIFIHLPSAAISGCGTCGAGGSASPETWARVEGKGISGTPLLDAETVREWVTRPTIAGSFAPAVTVRSVLNMEEFHSTDSYTPTTKIRDHVQLAHNACSFPFCTAAAWKCDADHSEPWKPDGDGGATCTCMLAALCRRHHRLKTHSDNLRDSQKAEAGGEHAYWTYAHLGGGEYYWRGPRGLAFIRSNRGTYEVAGSGATGAPLHPMAPLTHEERLRVSRDTVEKLLARVARVAPDGPELRISPGQKIPLTSAEARRQAERPAEEKNRAAEESLLERDAIAYASWFTRGTPSSAKRITIDTMTVMIDPRGRPSGGEAE